jgi:hypothetical protein
MYRFIRRGCSGKKSLKIDAADLDRQTVGEAFLMRVIGDADVRAAGERLYLKCPEFEPLFKKGKFPVQKLRRRAFRRHQPPDVNIGYSELKERWRRQTARARAALSGANRASTTPGAGRPPNFITWDHRWPVAVLNVQELAQALSGEDDTSPGYWRHPFKGLISNAVCALSDRHRRFFDLVREGQLVAEGIFRNTGQELPIPEKEWDRPDRYLDVQNSDLLNKKDETFGILWESVTLRLPNQGESPTPRRTRPVDQALEPELRKRGLADGRHGKTDSQIAYDLVDQHLTGEALQRAVDKKRQQLKRYYQRRGCS